MERFRIRPYRSNDAQQLQALFVASVTEIGGRHYTPEQVRAWAMRAPTLADFDARAKDGRLLLVAEDDQGEPLAYGDLEADGHIDHLYCRPDMVGKGIASALYDELENAARSRGIVLLYVEASEIARAFFAQKGFTVQERRDFELDGVSIHNYAMVRAL